MRKIILFCLLAAFTGVLAAQTGGKTIIPLQPYEMHGHHNPLKRNISFGPWKTRHTHRTFGSLFSFGNIFIPNILLEINGIPFYKEDQNRSREVFSFDLLLGDSLVSSVRCRAIFRKKETFRLLSPQDSSFFGAANTDFLQAVILQGNDTSQVWQMAASNLNGSKEEEQKGVLRHGQEEISFVKTTMVLREQAVDRTNISSLLATLNMVYAFSYHQEVVAAVSFKDADKRVWIKEGLDTTIAAIIANAAIILTLRRQLYH